MNITLLLSTMFKLDILFIFEGQAALLSGNAFMCPYYTDRSEAQLKQSASAGVCEVSITLDRGVKSLGGAELPCWPDA